MPHPRHLRRLLPAGLAAVAVGAALVPATPSRAATWGPHVNAGGPQYTDSTGQLWTADSGFTGGTTSSTTHTIKNTKDQALYQRQRAGMTSWSTPVPSAGYYHVDLRMSENVFAAAGKRVFDVYAEGVPVIRNLDLFAAAGQYAAVLRSVEVPVTDGQLDLTFTASVGQATVAAVSVAPTTVVARVNGGGSTYVDPQGRVWATDSGATGGTTGTTTKAIASTTLQGLYQSWRSGMSAYAVPVPAAATYHVSFRLADVTSTAAGQRVFSVAAEGTTVVKDLDVFKTVGTAKALAVNVDVPVTDGSLDLAFTASAGSAILNGLEVTQGAALTTSTATASPTPTATATTSPSPSPSPTTTTTTTTTPTTSPTTSTTGSKLTWAPPALTSPTHLYVTSSYHSLTLDTTKDYVIHMPSYQLSVLGGLVVVGGHNVVLIGGSITIPYAGASPTINDRRGLYFKGQTGTVHVEGVLIDNTGGDLTEGIQINAPAATVQIQNVRVTGIHARDESGYTDNHPDLIQCWGGVAYLKVDKFSGSTDYQGFNITPDLGPLGYADIRRANIWSYPADKARYLFWQGNTSTYGWPKGITVSDTYIKPATGRALDYAVWPDKYAASPHTAKTAADTTVSWPLSGSGIAGKVTPGSPSSGDFVPVGVAGLGYVSPGYL